jgi:hypothetical protein
LVFFPEEYNLGYNKHLLGVSNFYYTTVAIDSLPRPIALNKFFRKLQVIWLPRSLGEEPSVTVESYIRDFDLTCLQNVYDGKSFRMFYPNQVASRKTQSQAPMLLQRLEKNPRFAERSKACRKQIRRAHTQKLRARAIKYLYRGFKFDDEDLIFLFGTQRSVDRLKRRVESLRQLRL